MKPGKHGFWYRLLVVALCVLPLLTACSQPPAASPTASVKPTEAEPQPAATNAEPTGKPFDGVTLHVHYAAGFPEVLVLIKHAQEFEDATGVKLVFVESAWDQIDAKQNLAMTTHSGEFDLLYVGPRGYQLVQPFSVALDPYIENDADFGSVEAWAKQFPSAQIENNLGPDGKVYSWPFHNTAQFGVYRTELFEDASEKEAFKAEYGYELKPPTNYEELLDVATFFTRDTNADGETDLYGLLTCGDKWQGGAFFYDQLYRHDIRPFDMDMKVELEDAAKRETAIKVAQYWHDMVYKHKVMPPDESSIGSAQMVELWKAGKAAMSYGWWADYYNTLKDPAIIDQIGETASFNLFPVSDQLGGTIAWSSWAISADSKSPEAAYEFIKWATNKSNKMEVAKDYGYPPPVTEWAEEAKELGYTPEALPQAIAAGMLWPPLAIPEAAQINTVIQEQGNAIFADAVTPEEAIDNIAKGVKDILVDAGYIE